MKQLTSHIDFNEATTSFSYLGKRFVQHLELERFDATQQISAETIDNA